MSWVSKGQYWRLVLALAAGMVLLLVTLGIAVADAVKGKDLYSGKFCARCHGNNGEGGYGPPLAATTLSAADVVKQVRTPRARMPSFSDKQVTDAELGDILDFVKTLPRPATAGTYQFAARAGDPAGQVIFIEKGCAACHGIPPSVAGTKLAPAEEITQVRTPRSRMGAFTAVQISDADVTTVNRWLASLPAPTPRPTAVATPQAGAQQLPRTGEEPDNTLPMLLLAGFALLAGGLFLRTLLARRG
ncbi:MAG: cytochrome c [Chloroflexi bacterium]|nr:cytochrome c [Chloroflexota bacterium]